MRRRQGVIACRSASKHRFKLADCLVSRLNQTYRQLLGDHELLAADHKQLKGELNQAKLEHTWLDADYSKLKKEFQQLDITTTKLTNQCEVLPLRPDVRLSIYPSIIHLSTFLTLFNSFIV